MAAPIDPKIKAAVLAEVATGQPVATVAKKYGVHRTQVRRWREERLVPEAQPVVPQEQRDQLGEAINAWTVKAIQALTVQLDLAMDLDWLRGHSPADFAALITVLADQVARVAETQEIGQPSEGAPTPISEGVRRSG